MNYIAIPENKQEFISYLLAMEINANLISQGVTLLTEWVYDCLTHEAIKRKPDMEVGTICFPAFTNNDLLYLLPVNYATMRVESKGMMASHVYICDNIKSFFNSDTRRSLKELSSAEVEARGYRLLQLVKNNPEFVNKLINGK
jgi:hypothetical protein